MVKATINNFVKKNGEFTNLYKVVKTILYNDNYCKRIYLDELFNNWQSLNYVLDKFDGFIKTKEGNRSFFSITTELYEVYVAAMRSINRPPIRWTDIPKKKDEVEITKDKIDSEINKTRDAINREVELTRQKEKDNNIHYVDYDMEVESMDMKTAKNILNENGYYLVDEN